MHYKMYKVGLSSNIQIVSGQKKALCTLGFVYVNFMVYMCIYTIKSMQNDLKLKHYYDYQIDMI